jgi:acetyl esterase/lipase
MSFKVRRVLTFGLVTSLLLGLTSTAEAANPDDGYPAGVSAPGRTCPESEIGTIEISAITQKSLVCTLVNNEKKWWISGEPLPLVSSKTPSVTSESNASKASSVPVINYTPKYKLSTKAFSKMKIFENVKYANYSATQRLDIYMPKNIINPPLVIWTHGGGFIFGDEDFLKFDDSAKLLEEFIKNGVAVASVNYRLAQEAAFPAAGVDTKSAIRFLRANAKKYGFDPKKFAVAGDSAGGYLALMAGITGDQASVFDDPKDPNLKVSASVSTVIDLFGNADFFEMSANNANYPCDQSKNPFPVYDGNMHPWFGDTTNINVQAVMKSAGLYPLIKSQKKLPAFYIFHGTDDCSVSQYDSKSLDKAVKASGGKSSLALIPGAIHGGPEVWKAVMKAVPTIKKKMLTAKYYPLIVAGISK